MYLNDSKFTGRLFLYCHQQICLQCVWQCNSPYFEALLQTPKNFVPFFSVFPNVFFDVDDSVQSRIEYRVLFCIQTVPSLRSDTIFLRLIVNCIVRIQFFSLFSIVRKGICSPFSTVPTDNNQSKLRSSKNILVSRRSAFEFEKRNIG